MFVIVYLVTTQTEISACKPIKTLFLFSFLDHPGAARTLLPLCKEPLREGFLLQAVNACSVDKKCRLAFSCVAFAKSSCAN